MPVKLETEAAPGPRRPFILPVFLPRTGLKAGWVWVEALEAPHCPPGCPWPAQGPLESTPSPAVDGTGTVLPGHPPHAGRPSGCGPGCASCLTTSLAHVGIFLEMRWSRAGDCGQGGRKGREHGKRGRQAGRAVGDSAGVGTPGSWSLVLAAGDSTLERRPQTLHHCCTPSLSGDIWLPAALCPGDQRRKRTSSGKAASPGGAAGRCRPDVGWAGPCNLALQVSGAGGQSWRLGCAWKHLGPFCV